MCIPIYNLKRGTLYIQIPWTKPSVQLSSGKRTKTTIRTFPARNQQHCSKAFTCHTEKRIINRLKKLKVFFSFCYYRNWLPICLSAWYTSISGNWGGGWANPQRTLVLFIQIIVKNKKGTLKLQLQNISFVGYGRTWTTLLITAARITFCSHQIWRSLQWRLQSKCEQSLRDAWLMRP